MRDDEPEELPSMWATDDDRVTAQDAEHSDVEPPVVRAMREPVPPRSRNGALWAVCLSLLLALVGLGYWSHEQQEKLQRQLIATQESFTRVSEAAAGRLQDITGKVSATESTLSVAEQAQRERLQQFDKALDALQATTEAQDKQLAALRADERATQKALQEQQTQLKQLDAAASQLPAQLQKLQNTAADTAAGLSASQQDITALQEQLDNMSQMAQQLTEQAAQLDDLNQQLAQQQTALAALRRDNGSSAEQDVLVLRSELEQSTSTINQSLESIDRFRLQTNRAISTLREQLSTMQRQR